MPMGYFADQVQAWYYAWPEFFRYIIVQFIPVIIGLFTYSQARRASKAVHPNHGSSLRDAVNRIETEQAYSSECFAEIRNDIADVRAEIAELHAKNEIWHADSH